MRELVRAPNGVMMDPMLHVHAYVTGRNWYMEEDFHYVTRLREFPWKVIVPQYFPTDLASIPRPFWPFFNRNGWSRPAAVVHDWLTHRNKYVNQEGPDGINRNFADRVFLECLLAVIGMRRREFLDKASSWKKPIIEARMARDRLSAHMMYAAVAAYSQVFRVKGGST